MRRSFLDAGHAVSKAWSGFFLADGPPDAIGLFRIGYVAIVLVRLLSLAPHVKMSLSAEGVLLPAYAPLSEAPSLLWAWVIYLASAVAALAVLVGFLTRISCVALFLGLGYHYVAYFQAT